MRNRWRQLPGGTVHQPAGDVLVVGGGAAGARAALEASSYGVQVTLVTKGRLGAIGITGAGGTGSSAAIAAGLPGLGYAAVTGLTEDATLDLVLQAGLGLTDRRLAEVVVEQSHPAIQGLQALGLSFPGGEGLGGRQHGVPIMGVLANAIRHSPIHLVENATALDLSLNEGQCVGATVLTADGGLTIFRARTTILATGGCGQLFQHTLVPKCVAGDGYALGYRAGASLVNMEFSQAFLATIHPSRNVLPWHVVFTGKQLSNDRNEKFLASYFETPAEIEEALRQHALHNPFSTRDSLSSYLEIAMVKEILAGHGSSRDGLFLDLREPGALPVPLGEWLAYRGIHCDSSEVEVGISHQCSNGGLWIDEHGRTTVPRLYACGEQAGGPHGADRLGGQMLLAAQVFGLRSGRHAARTALAHRPVPSASSASAQVPSRRRKTAVASTSEHISDLKAGLQKASWRSLLILRNAVGLKHFLSEISGLRVELGKCDPGSIREIASAVEMDNLLTVAEMIARAALLREESRGPHYREDFPKRDDACWQRRIEIHHRQHKMLLRARRVDRAWKDQQGDLGGRTWG